MSVVTLVTDVTPPAKDTVTPLFYPLTSNRLVSRENTKGRARAFPEKRYVRYVLTVGGVAQGGSRPAFHRPECRMLARAIGHRPPISHGDIGSRTTEPGTSPADQHGCASYAAPADPTGYRNRRSSV